MRWLLHGNLAPAVAEALRRHEQTTFTPGDVELASDAPLEEVFAVAVKKQVEIITADPTLAAAPFENGAPFARTLVFLQLSGGEVEQDDAIDRLFQRYRRLSHGRMYTVTATRVKIRQLPVG